MSAFSASTGQLLADVHIPSSIHDGLTDFLVLSDTLDDESAPYIVWLEKGALKFVRLTENLDAKTKHLKGFSFKRILNIGLNERGWFVALKEDGTGVALRTDKDSMGLKHLWEFAESAVSDRYSESIYTGGLDKDNFPYVGRVFWSHYLSVRPQISFLSQNFNISILRWALRMFLPLTSPTAQDSFAAIPSHFKQASMGLSLMCDSYIFSTWFCAHLSLGYTRRGKPTRTCRYCSICPYYRDRSCSTLAA